jgi:cytochrome bd-type quinol oxidase subunit 2
MTDPLFTRWAAEGADARFTDPDALRRMRTQFERRVRRRNLVEYLAGAVVVPVFAFAAWLAVRMGDPILALGWGVGIVGIAVVLTALYHRAGNLAHRPEIDARSHLRAQLVHQREALESVPRWYLAPLVPGIIVVLVATALRVARDGGWLAALLAFALPAIVVGGLFVGVAWLNRRAARFLAREIAALDALD